MPPHVRRGNARRGKVQGPVEHVFACQKQRLRLVVRTVGLARARSWRNSSPYGRLASSFS